MFIGIVKNDLMVRVGPDRHEEALAKAHVRPMDFAGRPMRGYVYVAPRGAATPRACRVDRLERRLPATVKKSAKRPTKPKPKPKAARKR